MDSLKLKDGSTVQRSNYIQVTDKRGTNAGWRLQVQQGAQFSTASNNVLKGAELSLSNPHVVTTSDNNSVAPTPKDKIILVPGTTEAPGAAQDVIAAQEGQGMGTWVDEFGQGEAATKSVALSVPVSAQKVKGAQYTTELTWNLLDTPA